MARGGDGIGGLVKWGLILGGGYLGYKWWTGQGSPIPAGVTSATALPPAAPAAPAPAPAAAPAAPAGPSAAAVSQLQAVYDKMVAIATAANMSVANPDQWGYFLAQAMGSPAPDPVAAFPAFNRATNWPAINSVQYWSAIGPLVASSHGLSGIAARMAGLGALVGAYGR